MINYIIRYNLGWVLFGFIIYSLLGFAFGFHSGYSFAVIKCSENIDALQYAPEFAKDCSISTTKAFDMLVGKDEKRKF